MRPVLSDAQLAMVLLSIDRGGLKGAIVRGGSRSACETWIDEFVNLAPVNSPVRRIPGNITEERLLGGLDFAATIASGHAVAERGVLSAAHDGVVILPAATTRAATWSHVARALESGEIVVERDGLAQRHEARFTALVPEVSDDEPAPAAIVDRVAFIVAPRDGECVLDVKTVTRCRDDARECLAKVGMQEQMLVALCEGANALGISSFRVTLSALAAARAHAAWCDRSQVTADDLACAARLVLAPRVTAESSSDARSEPADALSTDEAALREPSSSANQTSSQQETSDVTSVKEMTETVVKAAQAAIPAGLYGASAARMARAGGIGGKAGAEQVGIRGRQVGTRRGRPTGGARLDLVATLRAAAPMQRVRRTNPSVAVASSRTMNPSRHPERSERSAATRMVELRKDDFRVRRCVTPSTTTTIFIVDASGSSALHRLAEAKGAVELMLAEGYARRERVGVIAFRGTAASLVLPPTHALARARRAIAGMPAGGGTPLASALDLAAQVIIAARRDSSQVIAVLLTDGRANVSRDGTGGRARAQAEALESAKRLATLGNAVVLLDTAPRPEAFARELAAALAARYVPLPIPTATGVRDVLVKVRGIEANG